MCPQPHKWQNWNSIQACLISKPMFIPLHHGQVSKCPQLKGMENTFPSGNAGRGSGFASYVYSKGLASKMGGKGMGKVAVWYRHLALPEMACEVSIAFSGGLRRMQRGKFRHLGELLTHLFPRV